MPTELSAPQIDHYISMLKHSRHNQPDSSVLYDAASYKMLDELYHKLEQLKPRPTAYPNRKLYEFWIKAPRGPIEDFGDYEEYFEDGEVESREEFENLWKAYYPDEVCWYNFAALLDTDINYRAIFIEHKFLIELSSRKKEGFEYDISEFTAWLLQAADNCIAGLKAGVYNETVRNELPAEHRTGTILRKDLWDAYPEWRASFFEPISEEDIQEFLAYAEAQPKRFENLTGRLPLMTANDFFSFCALGYRANDYKGCEATPREQYYQHADGRDEGLGEIDPDSPDAFENWYHHRERRGGHPWEVCRGGNSTHISLYVHHDEQGYALSIAGSAWNRSIETIKFYLALKRKGLPVFIHDAKLLSARLTETELVGIVPKGIFPAYCESMFPGGEVEEFMNLSLEEKDQLIPHCVWQEIPPVELIDDPSVSGGAQNE